MNEFDRLNEINSNIKASYIKEIQELRAEVYALRQENKLLLEDLMKLSRAILDLVCLQKMEDIR